ncbi:MAG: ATP synthase F1 subunit epsilon [Candidatus Alcyoniella australis]|nr:ATP synthase F1 subunit epsilon [Candidatus Alcyoniella australis]
MSQKEEVVYKLPSRMRLEFITPLRVIYEGPADSINLPGSMGYIGLLPGHDPLMTTLGVGPVKLTVKGEEQSFYCGGGFMEVNDELVRMLVEVAEKPTEIDVDRAEQARKRAEERLLRSLQSESDIDFMRAATALQRALTRIELSRK